MSQSDVPPGRSQTNHRSAAVPERECYTGHFLHCALGKCHIFNRITIVSRADVPLNVGADVAFKE